MEILQDKQQGFSIYQTTVQVLMTKIYKLVNEIVPPIMNSLFEFHLNQYNLRKILKNSLQKKETCLLWFRNINIQDTHYLGKTSI